MQQQMPSSDQVSTTSLSKAWALEFLPFISSPLHSKLMFVLSKCVCVCFPILLQTVGRKAVKENGLIPHKTNSRIAPSDS